MAKKQEKKTETKTQKTLNLFRDKEGEYSLSKIVAFLCFTLFASTIIVGLIRSKPIDPNIYASLLTAMGITAGAYGYGKKKIVDKLLAGNPAK